ncbi:lipoprotein [Spiroplasma endosymbiont of Panorpa germanica]|uniref:lipoprotein n=1 Tax=Spiroplasma endosymbiont of Panorpa germanica TaxID=3066314 RepID=UPI0030D3E3DE
MKKLLTILGAFSLAVAPGLTTISCFAIGEDALAYLSTKISGDWEKSNKAQIYHFKDNSQSNNYDYSPIICDFLKLMGSDKYDTNKYRPLQLQFLNEMEFYNYKTENNGPVPELEYTISNPKSLQRHEIIYKNKADVEEKVVLNRIIRVENYTKAPEQVNFDVKFKDIIVKEYIFQGDNQGLGTYVATKNTKKVDIFVRNITIEELNSNAIIISQ